METACPKCGYVLAPLDTICPRCARMAQTPCAECGRMGVVARCEKCHKEVCAECAAVPGPPGAGPVTICRACNTIEQAAADEGQTTVELAARAQGGYGFFDSMSRAFTFLKHSVAMVFRDKDLILPSVLSTLVTVLLLGVVMLVLWRTGVLQTMRQPEETPRTWWWLAFAAGFALLSYCVSYFFVGMTVNLVDTHLHGRDAQLGEAFADAWKNAPALFSLAVVSAAVSLVTGSLRSRRGRGLGDVAADALDRVWVVATYLIVPAIVLEDISLKQAANRARDLHQRNLLGIAVGEVGVVVLTRILGLVGVILAAGLGYLVYAASAGALIPALVVGGLLLSVVMAFTTYVRTAYYTCLYLWAVATEQAGQPTAAPVPLAATLRA